MGLHAINVHFDLETTWSLLFSTLSHVPNISSRDDLDQRLLIIPTSCSTSEVGHCPKYAHPNYINTFQQRPRRDTYRARIQVKRAPPIPISQVFSIRKSIQTLVLDNKLIAREVVHIPVVLIYIPQPKPPRCLIHT